MTRYYLNLTPQPSGNYEVHCENCSFKPTENYDYLGDFYTYNSAITAAKHKHLLKKIEHCDHCANNSYNS